MFNDLLRERAAAGRGCWGLVLRVFGETLGCIVKENWNNAMHSGYARRPAIGTLLLLLVPLVMTVHDRAKAPGDGWHWGPADFIVMGSLLFGAGLLYEVLARKVSKGLQRVAVGGTILFALFAIWLELAVEGVSKLAGLVGA